MSHYRSYIDITPSNHSRMSFQVVELHDDTPSPTDVPWMREANTADRIRMREQYYQRDHNEGLAYAMNCLRIPETFKTLTLN